MSTLYEDSQRRAAARAKRETLTSGLQEASELADDAGLETQGIYEALASGRERSDPDYWTFKILQYLYEYMPFGKAGRWFVPIILGLGLYKAFEIIGDIVAEGWSSLKGSSLYQSAKEYIPFLPDRVVRDATGNVEGVTSGKILQAGLMSALPPYASMIVATLGPRMASGSSAEVAALKTENASLKNALALAANDVKILTAAKPVTATPYYTPIATAAAPAPAQSSGGGIPYWEQALIDKGLDWLLSDRVVRDANGPTSFGTLRSGRNNY